jgi:multidrug efflux system membrane fusion protein
VIGFVLLIAAGAAYWHWAGGATPERPRGRFRQNPNEAIPVRVIAAEKGSIDVQIRALGTVTPLNTVTVRSRLDGELVRVLFTEGQRVKAGDLLAEIDPRPYQVQLAEAQGQLEENRARLQNAQGDLSRFEKLEAEGLITRQQVATQEALVQQYTGALKANEAQVNNARLQLTYTRIVAPIDGRLGLRQVDPGNLIRSGDPNGLVVIAQMRPISVLFTVPEADLPSVLDGLRDGRKLSVQAWDRADREQLAEGVLQTVDNQIDTATGTIKLRARFANDDEQLFPNQFVNVRLHVRTLRDSTIIPAPAVQRASFGTFVYVLQNNNTVTIQRVALGPSQADRQAITSGLTPGQRVVLEGVDDLTEGAKVEVIGSSSGPRPHARPKVSSGPAESGGAR